RFDGTLRLRYEYASRARPQTAEVPLGFDVRRSLTPRLDGTASDVVYLGGRWALSGDGFLAPGEGGTHAQLRGTFTPQGGAARAGAAAHLPRARLPPQGRAAVAGDGGALRGRLHAARRHRGALAQRRGPRARARRGVVGGGDVRAPRVPAAERRPHRPRARPRD